MKLLPILFLSFFFAEAFAETIRPLPDTLTYNRAKANLGKKLFFEPGLSKDRSVACVNCHHLPGSGADTLPYSSVVANAEGEINAPSVLNARYHFTLMWDGRAKTLKQQVALALSNSNEMASSIRYAVRYLKTRSDYREEFNRLYRSGITEETLADAIAEFEKALVTPHARYDRYLNGERNLLDAKELRGERLFYRYGCISCHNGVSVGGNMYQKIGLFTPYYSDKNQLGRYNVTGRDKDRYVFKVPSLRNVAKTAPYMHDGKITTLKEAITVMGINQIGVEFTDNEIDELEAFLHTLTGETPKILRIEIL